LALRDNPFNEMRLPLLLSAAAALVIALVVGLAMLMSDRRETLQNQAYGVTRRMGDQVVVPVSGWMTVPLRWGQGGISAVQDYFLPSPKTGVCGRNWLRRGHGKPPLSRSRTSTNAIATSWV